MAGGYAKGSTLTPTRQLLESAARAAGIGITLVDVLCADAWSAFARGDLPTYYARIADAATGVAPFVDVIVLAQASMAGVVKLYADLPTPVLTSPQLGLEAAVRLYFTVVDDPL